MTLLAWLDDPDPRHGIRFARADGDWEEWTYPRLAELSRRVAAGLRARGVGRDDVVTVVQRSGPGFVASLFGTLLAGGTPSPVAPPMTFQDPRVYREHLARLFGSARPRLVLCDPELVDALAPVAAGTAEAATCALPALLEETDDPGPVRHRPAELALLQFTSGSSGVANGVRVPYPALEANLRAISQWLAITPDDPTATWLPVHHDMGLIGCLLTPVVNQTDIWLMRPEDFVARPSRYVRCFGVSGARLTAMPSFGLNYLARRLRPEDLDGCDFSQWRAIIVGAERVDRDALTAVHELLSPYGLRQEAFLPAYGLAEATLAVTGLPLPEVWRSVSVEPRSLTPGQPMAPATDPEIAQSVVGCGRPLAGVEVSIVDESGAELPDGWVGEIRVGGSSVAAGYLGGNHAAALTRLDSGTLYSGDAGFCLDGQLYVLGRLGDSMKIRGRAVFAEDVESLLAPLRPPPRRAVVALGASDGRPTVLVVFEQAQEGWVAQTPELLRPRTEDADVVVVDAPRGTISWTSSGKPKRRLLWRDFVAGRLPAARLDVTPLPDAPAPTIGGPR